MSHDKKIKILTTVIVAILVGVLFVDPVAQDLEYHLFSDRNMYLGIPNTLDVLSNIPFIIVGVYGLIAMKKLNSAHVSGIYKTVSLLFFLGLILTGLGSGYYHLAPSNETLVWDRLPMTLSFMAFFAFVLSVHLSERLGRVLLWPLVVLGISSVLYWAHTESINAGDLRFYAVVQFLPMILIPAIVLMFPSSAYKAAYIWWVIAVYVAAKLGEYFDYQIHDLLGISGHSLKHMVAALSGIAFLYALGSLRASARNESGLH